MPTSALIMGILNATPDSFSDGGDFVDLDIAVSHGRKMFSAGADIVDVGGESTRPGADPVAIETELSRVLPVVEALSEHGSVSIDTKNEPVARQAVALGADIINDVSANLGLVAGELSVGYIAMHMQGNPTDMQTDPNYGDVAIEVLEFLSTKAVAAIEAGAPKVWIDPGFGFGKSQQHNMELLANIGRFVDSGYPVAIGTSRKSMVARELANSDGVDKPPSPNYRLEGSLISAAFAMKAGVNLVRVHDVEETVRVRQTINQEL